MASDRPARVSDVEIRVFLPEGFPAERLAPLQAVMEHCTVHNSIVQAPVIAIVTEAAAGRPAQGASRSTRQPEGPLASRV